MKSSSIFASGLVLTAVGLLLLSAAPGRGAQMAWNVPEKLDLPSPVIDTAVSADGDTVFLLTAGEILVYSRSEKKWADRFTVSPVYDRIAYGEKAQLIVLTSSRTGKALLYEFDFVHQIDVSGLPFRGPLDAAVTVVVFDDYQCPYCARMEGVFDELLRQYPKGLRLVIKNFPLSSHRYALEAAAAALAADRQGRYRDFHQRLFEHYQVLDDDKISEIATSLGLDMERFNRDRRSAEILSLIARDVNQGRSIGVRGTPTIFVNGKRLRHFSPAGLEQKIQQELQMMKGPESNGGANR